MTPEREWRLFVARWMGLALAFHLIAAWFSVGHHSVDEYFQILEFLSYKRGLTPMRDLAVEFQERMRPWMQPFIYGQLIRAWEAVGVQNPFTWAWSFRLADRAPGLGRHRRARPARAPMVRGSQGAALLRGGSRAHLVLAGASCSPLFGEHGRLGLFAGAGAAHERRAGRCPVFSGGALLGLSFEARFQMGFMIAGLLAWLVFMARVPWRKFVVTAAGLAFVFRLGAGSIAGATASGY